MIEVNLIGLATLTVRPVDVSAYSVLSPKPHVNRPLPRIGAHTVEVGVREEMLNLSSFFFFPSRDEQSIFENDDAVILGI